MAGNNFHQKSSQQTPPQPQPRKSRWEASASSSKPTHAPNPQPDLAPPPPPTYGFHMLERRTIVLADGTVRSYFALPPDYQDFALPPRPQFRFFPPLSPDAARGSLGKRKYEEWGSSPFKSVAGEDLRVGKAMRGNKGVEESDVKKAFLHFVKVVNEIEAERNKYLEEGKHGRLHCLVCGRSTKDFPDVHALVLHAYNSENAEVRVDHLGLHRALCVLRGWNFSKPPDNSKSYQFLPAELAAANQDDLIIWPPTVIIHNTITGKGKEGRMEGLGNKAMDSKIRDLGCAGGKSKSLYGREGHLGITLIRFSGDQAGLKEALKLAEHFEKENRGRKSWMRLQPVALGKDDEKNPNLVKVERDGEKRRILYGYLGTAADLYKVDFDTKKKVKIESQRDYRSPK